MNYISVTEFARVVGCSRQNIHQVIKRGKLETSKVGSTYIINEEELEKFLVKKGE